MSRNASYSDYRAMLEEIARRYDKARTGYEFDFKTEIEPFLNENKELADQLLHIKTDERLTERVREIMSDELMELLMSCHVSRFSLKLYHEKFKYINMWVNHAGKEGLL